MRPLVSGVLTLALFTGAGCAFVGPPTLVAGVSRDVALLEGSWSGEYTGDVDHGRHGTISFKLEADSRMAHGSVLMRAEGLPFPYARYPEDPQARPRPDPMSESSLLSIRFVYVSDGVVSGELDPYWDPDRNARAVTTFQGTIDGGMIVGTFRTRYSGGVPATAGGWKVTRHP